MAAFNVSSLSDFGYIETTHFIDLMEPRWLSVPIGTTPPTTTLTKSDDKTKATTKTSTTKTSVTEVDRYNNREMIRPSKPKNIGDFWVIFGILLPCRTTR